MLEHFHINDQYKKLQQACVELSVQTTEVQNKQLLDYLNQLLKWNQTYNLTAIREPNQALIQHIFDSLAIVPSLGRYLAQAELKNPNVLDVGSGAGLPGVVIAIMYPFSTVTCVDPVEKKIAFIRQIASVLKLQNLKAIHARVEDLPLKNYDLATCRAFASLEDFVRLTGPRLTHKGALLAMKGKIPVDEVLALQEKTSWFVEQTIELKVPELNAQRCMLWIKHKGT